MKENTRYFLMGMLVSYTSVLLVFCFGFFLLLLSSHQDVKISTPTKMEWPVLIYTSTLEVPPTISFEDAHNTILTKVANYTPTSFATLEPTLVAVPTQAPQNHPVKTTGRCADGSYTEAKHSQGACSHHGGLVEWWGTP